MLAGASSYSALVDQAFWFIFGTSVVLLLGVTAVMVYFIVRYRRSKNPVAKQIDGSITLETIWTVLPTILVLVMFYYGWAGFKVMRDIPENAMEVKVYAQMWAWLYEYPNGKQSTELVVPTGLPVKLSLNSRDVIHSFYVPAFRLKEDCVPGRENRAWFQAENDGEYKVLCAEYCGDLHSQMLSTVRSVPLEQFRAWLTADVEDVAEDKQLLLDKGCLACHTTDGGRLIGPTFQGLYGREETVRTDGEVRKVIVDEDYIRRSVREPLADVVDGYQPVMPSMDAVVNDEELDEIVEILRRLE